MIPQKEDLMKLLITICAVISFSANAQSWRDCVRNSIVLEGVSQSVLVGACRLALKAVSQ